MLATSCAYSYVFDAPAATDRAKERYANIPPPYLFSLQLNQQRDYQAGETIAVDMTLVSRVISNIPYLIHAFNLAGENGIGRKDPTGFVVDRAQVRNPGMVEWHTIYENGALNSGAPQSYLLQPGEIPNEPVIQLLTPLRLKRRGDLVKPQNFSSEHFFTALTRRIAELLAFYGDSESSPGWRELMPACPLPVITQATLKWHDWTRYSSRQKSAMQMGGIIGHLHFNRSDIEPWQELLYLGQSLNIGKTCSMGLGRYRLTDAASLPDGKDGQTVDRLSP